MSIGFDHMTLAVTDVEEAERFLAVLGFKHDKSVVVSGETIVSIAVYFVSWAGLGLLWRRSNPPLLPVVVVTAALVAIGLLGTFPPFFRLFGVEE